MIHGDPGFDVWAMDVARFGDWATMAYTNAKVRENYSRRFRIRFPNEELPAARPLRMTPVYDRLNAKGAVFGAAFGLEHALWFAPPGTEARENVTYRRSNAHEPVGDECRAVRNAVGLIETSSFAKYEVTGAGAGAWLELILANRLPREGRLTLSPMLNEMGKADRRFHGRQRWSRPLFHIWFRRCRAISPALVRISSAALGRRDSRIAHRAAGTWHRRPAVARVAVAPHRRGCLERRVSLSVVSRDGSRDAPRSRRPHIVHRRAGLRNLGARRLPACAIRCDRRGRR
jgi:hypothetical protein